ncbi:PadR family transcriptional regulator [Nocardia sp. NPDC088792]|uniref:PadR family transcriptional regulator n=1 Tax=Nocardia sp. NPDC088792 TaxID=3364332 RepID=UPI0037F5B657
MPRKRKVSNLMGLAVLSTLAAGPAHRYEIAARMRSWGKEHDMGVKWGSLYTVVDNLAKHGYVEVAGSERDGARPERTIYRITESGQAEMNDWTRELLSSPEPEQRRFMAGLSILMVLPPDEVADLLAQRITRLDNTIERTRAELATFEGTLSHLFLVEQDYELAMLEAEAAWARTLHTSLLDGTFPDLQAWRDWHQGIVPPEQITASTEGGTDRSQQRPD